MMATLPQQPRPVLIREGCIFKKRKTHYISLFCDDCTVAVPLEENYRFSKTETLLKLYRFGAGLTAEMGPEWK